MQKHTFNVLGVLLAVALLVSMCVGAVAAADWTTYMGNDGRTGYTSEEGPSTNNVLWSIEPLGSSDFNYECTVVHDGRVYVSVHISGAPSLYCYDAESGEKIWSKTLLDYGCSSNGGITIDGNFLYVLSYDSGGTKLVKVSLDGESITYSDYIIEYLWGGIKATPFVFDGSVWLNTVQPTTTLYQFNLETLSLTNSYLLPGSTGATSASISSDGTNLYFPGDGGVMMFNPKIDEKPVTLLNVSANYANGWQVTTPVYNNEHVFIYTYTQGEDAEADSDDYGVLYAISTNNPTTYTWKKDILSAVSVSSPAVSNDYVVIGNQTGLIRYTLTGEEEWFYESNTPMDKNTPIIAGDIAYFGSAYHGWGGGNYDAVHAVDLKNKRLVWSHDPETPQYKDMIEGSLAISDGKLYYGDMQRFYAIGEPTSLFDGTVKLGTEKVDILLNDGVYLRTVAGTSVMAAIHAAAEKGGFDYNMTYDDTNKFSLKGFAGFNNNTKCSWVVYCGETPIDINTYPLKDGDTLNIYYCGSVDGEWDTENARPSVTITVDVPAAIPTTAAKIYDGSVALKTGSVPIAIDEDSKKNVGENTVLGVLDAAAKAGGFTYNVTYSSEHFSLKNISGYGDNTWKLYINGVEQTDSTKTIDTIEVNDGDHVAFYDGEISSAEHYVIITAKEKPSSFTLTLKSGWNFVSVPQTLATDSNTVEKVFGSVLGEGGVLAFNGETQSWVQATKDTVIKPLEAYWVDAKAGTSVNLYYNTNDPTVVPSSKKLHEGWNAVGISADDDITVDEFLGTYNNWQAIIPWNSVSQDFASQINKGSSNTQTLEQGAGNWLYITSGNSLVGSL